MCEVGSDMCELALRQTTQLIFIQKAKTRSRNSRSKIQAGDTEARKAATEQTEQRKKKSRGCLREAAGCCTPRSA